MVEKILILTRRFTPKKWALGLGLRQSLEIGDSWSKDLCVYVQTSIYIEFYNRIVNNQRVRYDWS